MMYQTVLGHSQEVECVYPLVIGSIVFLSPGGVEELGLFVLASLDSTLLKSLVPLENGIIVTGVNWDTTASCSWVWDESLTSKVKW